MDSSQQTTFLYMGMVEFDLLSALVQFVYLGFHDLVGDKKLDQLASLASQLEISMSGEKAKSEDTKSEILEQVGQSDILKSYFATTVINHSQIPINGVYSSR